MASSRVSPINELSLPAAAAGRPARPSDIEREVIGLFDQWRASLLRYVLSFGIPVQDGEEVIQEVFLALFRHLQMGKSRENLRGWIFRVAHNLALKQRAANRWFVDESRHGEGAAAKQFDAAPNPEEEMAHGQRVERLRAVVNALPEQDRYCLYLRAEGLRYREIAATLGISLGAVSMALTRSLARLARADQR
jgi:RNA polymerase sigma-70 factor, ECF subfamily